MSQAHSPGDVECKPRKRTTRDIKAAVALWDYNRLADRQDPATLDAVQEILKIDKTEYDDDRERPCFIYGTLQTGVHKILAKAGFGHFSYGREDGHYRIKIYPRTGVQNPRVPSWLQSRIQHLVVAQEPLNLRFTGR